MQKVIVEIKLFFNVRIVSKSPAELSLLLALLWNCTTI